MTWLRQAIDHLFTEPRDAQPPTSRFSSEAAIRHREADRRRNQMEIEIEARRGVVGF